MKSTIEIHYDYDETQGTLPSGLPKSPAFCNVSCPHLSKDKGVWPYCELFQKTLTRQDIGNPKRLSFIPTHPCRHHEMQGR